MDAPAHLLGQLLHQIHAANDLVLAGVIIAGLPGTLVWALGLLVGIDMLFGGASLIAMALHSRAELAQRGTE